jgi:hypothetical protein
MSKKRHTKEKLVIVGVIALLLTPVAWVAYRAVPLLWAEPGDPGEFEDKLIELGESVWDTSEPSEWAELIEAVQALAVIDSEINAAEPAPTTGEMPYADHSMVWTTNDESRRYGLDTDEDGVMSNFSRRSLEMALSAIERGEEDGLYERIDELVRAPNLASPVLIWSPTNFAALGMTELRGYARAQRARMHLALLAGDEEAFVARVDTALGMTRAIRSQPVLLYQLVGVAIEAMVLDGVVDAAMRGLQPEALGSLLQAVRHADHDGLYAHAFEGERLHTLRLVHGSHCTDGCFLKPEFDRLIAGQPSGRFARMGGAFMPKRDVVERFVNDSYDLVIRLLDEPYAGRAALRAERDVLVAELDPALAHWDSVSAMADDITGVHYQQQARRAATEVVLLIELYRAEHGRPPVDLEELAEWHGGPLPEDTHSSTTMFGYRVLDEPDESGRTYLLYSVGIDGEDNGGRERPNPFDAFKEEGAGYDKLHTVRRSRNWLYPPE